MKKIALTALALTTLATAPALAATHHRAAQRDANTIAENADASAAYASANVQNPYAVVVQGQVVGQDPDANIRLELLRDNSVNVD
jgi:hypothetical protein